ncbi:NADH-quinone oxidoreductase subunit N [Orbaceae bacterium ESL0727]|nr:NADH-quinone oxidoreductase subunit N [Orbaceae bacterium ESL0727]
MITLSPIFILSIAAIVLLFLLFVVKLNTKWCALFTVLSLALALSVSSFIGYQIAMHSETITDISSDNMQIVTPTAPADVQSPNQATTESSEDATNPNAQDNTNDNVSDEAENSEKEKAKNEEKQQENDKTAATTTTTTTTTAEPQSKITANENVASLWQAGYVTALFTCDGYGLLYTSLILIISMIVCCFAYQWFKQEQTNHGLFYVILLFTTLGGVTLVYASHLISLFLGIELLSIPFVGLIGYQYTQTHSLEAAIKYMVLSAVASAFLLMGIAFYYAATGELTFSGLSYQLSTVSYPSTLLLMGVCLMLVGIGFKLSLVPFQLWLPDVYQGAPTAVSLLFSTIGKVAIFCAIARLFLLAPIVNNDTIRTILVIMAFCSILWGNFFALMQSNVKRLLAYSSIAHFGYLLTALIAVQYQVLALETIGVYLIGYILANICLLGGVSLESHSNERQDHENDVDLSGLFWRRPVLALSMGVGLLSLAGVPLTVGFIGRFLLVLLGVTAELWWLVGAIVVGSALGLYFYARLIINLYMKPMHCSDQKFANTIVKLKFNQLSLSEFIIALSAFLILLCGVYPKWLFNLVSMAQYLIP